MWSRSFLDVTDARQGTERRGPKGPPPTHVCLVRETRLLPPKAGRLASRSAKPTLDGSSLIKDLLVNIVWKSGKEQLADIMTKVLPAADYNTLRTLLMNLRYLELDGWAPAKLLK